MTAALELERVSVRLGEAEVLTDASLIVQSGETVAVLGPNGAGKTTLLRAALGLQPSQGGIRLFGRAAASLSPRERAERVGYLAQERRIAWGLPARRVVALAAPWLSPREADARAAAALARVGLAGLADRGVFDMSGGERARVLLARLFATGAPLLVADEPAAGLDPDAQLLVLDHLKAEASAGHAVLLTLHDLSLATRYADRVVVVHRGRIVADGAPLDALAPARLAEVFGLDGAWVDTPAGPVLAARRQLPPVDV
jgi:iron complex transport system ATP-binding protein